MYDISFFTAYPGIGVRKRIGLFNDIQRSFYSGYFGGHGMQLQALTFPNDMFGSVYIGTLRVSPAELMSMSSLYTYLSQLFRELGMHICDANSQFLVVYGDRICSQLSAAVTRYLIPDKNEGKINTCVASI